MLNFRNYCGNNIDGFIANRNQSGNKEGIRAVVDWLEQLGDEYDRYIKYTGDNPFWYGERSHVGFLATAVQRINPWCGVQEYTTPKEEETGKGRADLWLQRGNNGPSFLIEVKNHFFYESTASKDSEQEKSDWQKAVCWSCSALNQAKGYADGANKKDKPDYVVSMCFEPIYFKAGKRKRSDYIEMLVEDGWYDYENLFKQETVNKDTCAILEKHCREEDSIGYPIGYPSVDFYQLLKHTGWCGQIPFKINDEKYFYPAIAIYGAVIENTLTGDSSGK